MNLKLVESKREGAQVMILSSDYAHRSFVDFSAQGSKKSTSDSF